MSYLVDEDGYSLAAAHAAAIGRRARMSGNIHDPGLMSPKEYDQEIRYPAWRRARERHRSAQRQIDRSPPKDPTPVLVPLQSDEPIFFGERRPTIEQIVRAVCSFYAIPLVDIESNRRTAKIVIRRQIAMYLARKITSRSLPEIARIMGGRDHTTVYHAYKKIGELRETNAVLDSELKVLESRLSVSNRPKQVIYYGA